jgi:hypothetical protein
MKSKFISASVFAVAGLLSVSSFAEGGNAYPAPSYEQNTSTVTREQVKAELAQAKRDGTFTTFTARNSAYPPAPVANAGSGKTRAEVKAELMAAGPRASHFEVEHNYPFVQ